MTNPIGFHVVQGLPDNTIYFLHTDGLLDLLREMQIPLEQLVSQHPSYDQARLGREIAERKLAVVLTNVAV